MANEVASAIQEISYGTESQYEATKKVSYIVEDMSVKMKQVADNVDTVMSIVEKAAKAANNGGKHISKVINQMEGNKLN